MVNNALIGALLLKSNLKISQYFMARWLWSQGM